MREAALAPLPAIAGSEEAAPGDSGLLAREVVASAVGVAVARLGVVRLAVAIAGRARGVGHHLSPTRSAVAREAGAPGSSAVRRLSGGATLRVSVVSRLLLPGLP